MMGHAASEKICEHYDKTSLAPVRGGDAESRTANGGYEKQRGHDGGGQKHNPQMKRKSHRSSDFPRAKRAERK